MNRSPTKATPERHQISEPMAPHPLSPQPQRKPSIESGLATLHASVGNAAIATSEPPTSLAPATGSDVLAQHAAYGNSAIALAAKRGEFDTSATQRSTQAEFRAAGFESRNSRMAVRNAEETEALVRKAPQPAGTEPASEVSEPVTEPPIEEPEPQAAMTQPEAEPPAAATAAEELVAEAPMETPPAAAEAATAEAGDETAETESEEAELEEIDLMEAESEEDESEQEKAATKPQAEAEEADESALEEPAEAVPPVTEAVAAEVEPTPTLTPEAAEAEAGAEPTAEEATLATADLAGEEVIEAGAEEPVGAAGEGGAEPPTVAGGEGAPELTEWKAKVAEATRAIKVPEVGDAAEGDVRLRRLGGGAIGRAGGARKKLQKEAEELVKPPPSIPDPLLPPEQDPVPMATALVRAASDRKLPNQAMPPLQMTPGKIMPEPPKSLSTEYATKVATESEMALDAQEKAATAAGNKKELAKIQKARKALAKKFKADWGKGQAEPLVLVEEPSPPPAPMTKQTQTDIGKVLAALTLTQEEGAKEIVRDARREAFTDQVLLAEIFDEFGKDALDGVRKYLGEKIEAIGKQAGLGKDDLDRHVAERKAQLAEKVVHSLGALIGAAALENFKVKAEWQKNADHAAAAGEQADNHIGTLASEIIVNSDPSIVRKKREQLVIAVSRKTAQQSISYTQAGERRVKALTDTASSFIETYTKAAHQEKANYYKAAKKARKDDAAAEADARQLAEPTFLWLENTLFPDLNKTVEQMKTTAKETASGYDASVKVAGKIAIAMIASWAESLIGEQQRLWFEKSERDLDWEVQARETAAAWEVARTSEARDSLVHELDTLRTVADLQAGKIDQQQAFGGKQLTEQQTSVINDFYQEGPGKGDAILTVAYRLRARISAEQRPELINGFETKLQGLDDSQWRLVAAVAESDRSAKAAEDNVLHIASEVYKASKGAGTEEDRIYKALAKMTPLLTRAVRMCYRASNYGDIDERLKYELSGAEYERAKALMDSDKGTAGAAALRYAIFPGGSDIATVMHVLKTTPPAELREKFKKEYGKDLDSYLKLGLKGGDLERAQALLSGDKTHIYVVELKHAVSDENRKGLEAVYAQIRADVETKAAEEAKKPGNVGWKTDRLEAEIKKRIAEVEAEYNKGEAQKGKDPKSLRDDISKNFSGTERDLAIALHDNNATAADAARMKLEDKGGFQQGFGGIKYVTGDQKVISGLLGVQAERAHRDVERDLNVDFRERREALAKRQQGAVLRGWSKEEIQALGTWDEKKEREELKLQIKKQSDERAHENMKDFTTKYEEKYGGPGSLDAMINRNVLGEKQQKVKYLVKQGGILTPAQTIHYAVEDEDADAVKSFLASTSQEDMIKVEAEWKASPEGKKWLEKHKDEGKSFRQYITSKFEGRDKSDIEVDITGAAKDPKEMLARKQAKLKYEKTAYGWAAGRSPEEIKQMKKMFPQFEESDTDIDLRNMEEEVRLLEQQVARLDKYEPGSEQYQVEYAQYERQTAYVDQRVENYRDAVDFETDRVAMIAGIVATALVVVLTAGAATPLLIAAAAAGAAAAGAAATIAAKQLMKGSAYTRSEMMTDIVVGAVDAIVSAATAGLGGKLLRTVGPLAKLAKSPQLAPRLLAHGLAEGAENFVATVPSSFAAQLMDKRSQGVSFSSVFGGAAFGAALGGGMGMIGGFKKPLTKMAAADTADILAHRGTPAERLAGWQSFQKANPGKPYKDFLADLDAGILAHRADEEAVRQAQRNMRRELFTDIPPAQRGQFKDVAVDVVSDAEFARLTRNAKDQAAVILDQGKPRIVLREPVDPKVLREQGTRLFAELDTSAISRHAADEEARQIEKEMRRQFLSSIPPAQRSQFANVPIHVIGDDDWLKFGRSWKGQAAVIIEGGKPRVLVRQSADVRALREEGIHILQTTDPKLKHLFRQLDEARLAKWTSLSVNERIAAVNAKLEIEIDGQRRLIKSLNETLAEARGDQAAKSLASQIEAAEKNLKNLEGISDDVARLTPADRLSMSKGGPPRKTYLDEPPRLFSKKERPPRADPEAYRSRVSDSPLEHDLEPGESVHRIGDTWKEEGRFLRKGKWYDEERLYRQVEVLDAEGKVKMVREEIQMPDNTWRQRGSESSQAGKSAEVASHEVTKRMIARAQARGKVIKTLGKESQYGSGQGFDEVFFEFDAAGRAQVVIVEVKNYPGRHVPTEDFTAVLDNLEQNFDRLYKQLEDEAKFIRREMQLVQDGLKAAPDPSRLGLSLAEVESALEAIIEQNVSLHIRLGAGTKLGTFTAGSVIKNIKKAWADLGIRSRVPIKVMTIQKTLIDEAVVDVQTIIKRDFIGTRPKFYKVTDAAESLGAVKGPFKAGVGDVFVDSTGKLATMRTVKEADIVGTARDELASEIVERLAKPMMHPHTTAQAPLTVLLDVSALTPKARQELQAALEQAVARLKTEKSVLKRLHQITNVP